jgi:hypothetical protein
VPRKRKEGAFAMKLTSPMVEQTLSQFEAQALPDNHPATSQLNRLFGDHTFFLDGSGLHIVEPTEASDGGAQTGVVVKLARWSDATRTTLTPHPPETTDVIITLEAA